MLIFPPPYIIIGFAGCIKNKTCRILITPVLVKINRKRTRWWIVISKKLEQLYGKERQKKYLPQRIRML